MLQVKRVIKSIETIQQAKITGITVDCEDGSEVVLGQDVPLQNVQSLKLGDYLIIDQSGQRHILEGVEHENSLVKPV